MLAFALVTWTVYASTWLVALTVQEHCDHIHDANEIRLISREHAADLEEPSKYSTNLQQAANTGEKSVGALKNYASRIFRENTEDGCTMVMLTYKRVETLPKVLQHYCSIITLKRIVVVWNDVNSSPPRSLLNLSGCKVDVQFVFSKANKLTNRYLPRKEIMTECKLIRLILCMGRGFFSWRGSFKARPQFLTQRGALLAALSYAKKEGPGKRLLQSLVGFGASPHGPFTLNFALNQLITIISSMQILVGGSSVIWVGGVEHLGVGWGVPLCSPPPPPPPKMKP